MKEKSLLKNSVYNAFYKVINIIYPLITTAYISHVLQASGVGKVNFAQNIAQYFILAAPLGILNYGTREISRNRNNKELVNKIFSELFIINLVSSIICSIIYYILVLTLHRFNVEILLYSIIGLQIVLNIFNIEWLYIAFEEYRYITFRNLLIKGISLILLPLLVRNTGDYIQFAAIYSFGVIGNNVLNVLYLPKTDIRFKHKDISFRKHLRPVFVLFASIVAIEVYTLLDTTMLGFMKGDSVVAYYTNSSRVSKIVISLISSIGAVMLPRISYYINNGRKDEVSNLINKVTNIIIYLSFPCACGLFFLSDNVVNILFGKTFILAIPTLQISTLLILVLGLSNLFGSQVLVAFNAEKKLLISTIVGAVINFVLNSIMIPEYAQNGAIIASVISETTVFLLTYIYSKKYVDISIVNLDFLKTVIATVVMGAILLIIKRMVLNMYLQFVVVFVIGVIVYAFSSKLLKIGTFNYLYNRVRNRIIRQ